MLLHEIATTPAVTCRPAHTIADVAREMRENEVGCVVITDEAGRVTGIVTDRDLVVRAMANELPVDTAVTEVMSHEVVKLHEEADLEAACNTMAAWGTRRIPIVHADGTIAGLVSQDDVSRVLAESMDEAAVATRTPRLARR
jgi:CBS domain-containing protein